MGENLIAEVARVGQVYVDVYLRGHSDKFPRRANDWAEGLGFFLNGYAFERQGRSPAFAPTACKALKEIFKGTGPSVPPASLPDALWKTFCDLGEFPNGEGANKQNNPLHPAPGRKQSVGQLCLKLESEQFNIYRFTRRGLETRHEREIFDAARSVRGVGPKIASMFLRDVALDAGLDRAVFQEPELLQPVDIWVERVARFLGRGLHDEVRPEKIARALVELADEAGVSALLLNAGAWYLGARVVGSEAELKAALSGLDATRAYLRRHGERLRAEAEAVKTVCDR